MRPLAAALYRLFVCCVYAKLNLWSDGRAPAGALGKSAGDGPDYYFSHDRRAARLAGSRSFIRHHARLSFGIEETPRSRSVFFPHAQARSPLPGLALGSRVE